MGKKLQRIAVMLELVWPYKRHTGVFAGIQEYAQSRDWDTIIDEFIPNTLQSLRRKVPPYDGIIARATNQLADLAVQKGIPLVNVWTSSPARLRVPGVYPNATEAGRLIAEHLISRGICHFASLISSNNQLEVEAVREMKRILGNLGYQLTEVKVSHDPGRNHTSWQKTEDLITRIMDKWNRPIGIYVGQEEIGRLVAQMCKSRGWRVPADVAIIAGQNQETMCEFPRPSLTSIEFGYERVGLEAARLLDCMMKGDRPPAEPSLLPPQGLVVRESTDFFAVNDSVVAAALSYIAMNSHRSIGPGDVALAIGVEPRTLHNYFRKILDRPVAVEIRRVRIERAKRELVQSKRSLSEIAREVGFGNPQCLYEVFRREVGMTPSDYRKQRTSSEALSKPNIQ